MCHLSEHISALAEANADDGPGDGEESEQELGPSMNLEGHSSFVLLLWTGDGRIMVADKERLARLGEEARGEEKAGTAARAGSGSADARD